MNKKTKLPNNVKTFLAPERNVDYFLMSRIMNIDPLNASSLILDMQANIFRRLKIPQIKWLFAENSDYWWEGLINFKTSINQIEKFWYSETPNKNYGLEFQKMKNHNVFTSIEQIEQQAQNILGHDFSLQILFKYDSNNSNHLIKETVLDLYNFIVNSKILTKQALLQLLYPIIFTSLNSNEEQIVLTKGALGIKGTIQSTMIGMDVHYKWFKTDLIISSFKNGLITTNNFAHHFVHEFAHALCFFYNLGPQLKISLNKNIDDKNLYQSINEKINYHFNKNYDNHWSPIANHLIIENAVNYFAKKLINNEIISSQEMIISVVKMLVVPGHYGRTICKKSEADQKKLHPETEWFAEGFAYYFLTPPPQRSRFWNLWHEFFTSQINNFQQN